MGALVLSWFRFRKFQCSRIPSPGMCLSLRMLCKCMTVSSMRLASRDVQAILRLPLHLQQQSDGSEPGLSGGLTAVLLLGDGLANCPGASHRRGAWARTPPACLAGLSAPRTGHPAAQTQTWTSGSAARVVLPLFCRVETRVSVELPCGR